MAKEKKGFVKWINDNGVGIIIGAVIGFTVLNVLGALPGAIAGGYVQSLMKKKRR